MKIIKIITIACLLNINITVDVDKRTVSTELNLASAYDCDPNMSEGCYSSTPGYDGGSTGGGVLIGGSGSTGSTGGSTGGYGGTAGNSGSNDQAEEENNEEENNDSKKVNTN